VIEVEYLSNWLFIILASSVLGKSFANRIIAKVKDLVSLQNWLFTNQDSELK
jgi:hypothetical protein